MELNSQLVAPTLTGVAAFLLAWLAFGKGRKKAPATAVISAITSEDDRETKPPPAAISKPPRDMSSKPARDAGPQSARDTASKSARDAGPQSARDAPKSASDSAPKTADAGSERPPNTVGRSGRPASKAIVWEAAPGELADEDITVLHAIPVFDGGADLTIEAASVSIEGETEEDRVSRIELSYEEDAEAEEVTSASARILLYAAGDSDQGRVRKRNEDSLLVMPERSLFAVADGMGGHRGGAVASSLAIDALQDAFDREAFEGRVQSNGNVPRRGRELAAAVHMTNECVRSMAFADRELSDMGTTLVAARFSPNKQRLYVGHVGDSRCYRLRQGKLRQLTTDHTMASLGVKGPSANHLYQAIGVSPGLAIDLIVDKPQDDDLYVLCSDGLSKMVSDDELRDVLLEHEDLEAALYTLIEAANDRGGNDNVTVIIVKVLARASKKAMESIAQQAVSN
ncbi:MAG TPA: protein phosphatase 2C domain-containing protein [Polyangiaceae bacterium]